MEYINDKVWKWPELYPLFLWKGFANKASKTLVRKNTMQFYFWQNIFLKLILKILH